MVLKSSLIPAICYCIIPIVLALIIGFSLHLFIGYTILQSHILLFSIKLFITVCLTIVLVHLLHKSNLNALFHLKDK